MVFAVPTFTPREETQWATATKSGTKHALLEIWLKEIVDEAAIFYNRVIPGVSYDVILSFNRMKMVKAKAFELGLIIKDPLEIHQEEDYQGEEEESIRPASDGKGVVEWASKHRVEALKLYTETPGGYYFSKFRLFRRAHFWMEKTVDQIVHYEEAKELSKGCGYWEAVEDPNFSFREFITNPDDFTEAQFLSHLQAERELEAHQRMFNSDNSDHEEDHEDPSSSDASSDASSEE